MKILWLCNAMLPVIGTHLGMEATNKEGWISGLLHQVLHDKERQAVQLAIAFPADKALLGEKEWFGGSMQINGRELQYFGFAEDTAHPEQYDAGLEKRLAEITAQYQPDIVHLFGTEYPHALAMTRAFPHPESLLVGIQGLCSEYAYAYFANLPEQVIGSSTLRDVLKKDSLRRQQEKFVKRGELEIEAIKNIGNITGRTAWDRYCTQKWNKTAIYYKMNETLRPDFYTEVWEEEKAEKYSIFLSQGDYPIKGLHYMLLALPKIREKYPQVKVYVAGNPIVKGAGFKERLKISSYGKYIEGLIADLGLGDAVVFLGRLNAAEMKQRYLHSSLFVCCSSAENSPNSLGEAMLLGMPCVSADVGGITSIMTAEEDGIIYPGFCYEKDGHMFTLKEQEEQLQSIAGQLAESVLRMWSDPEKQKQYCENARNHAKTTHNGEENYGVLQEIYAKMMENDGNRRGKE